MNADKKTLSGGFRVRLTLYIGVPGLFALDRRGGSGHSKKQSHFRRASPSIQCVEEV